MTAQRIDRLLAGSQHDHVLNLILDNGRPVPLRARLLLTHDARSLGASAIGLGIQRCLELRDHQQGERTPRLILELLDLQASDGSFGNLASSSIAIAALLCARKELARLCITEELSRRVEDAIDFGLHALHAGCVGGVSAVEAAFAMWQLSEWESARVRLPEGALRDAIATDDAEDGEIAAAILALGGLAPGAGLIRRAA